MKIKDYTCKCGSNQFFYAMKENSVHMGIYCENCGKWLKWANMEERRLRIRHEVEKLEKSGDITIPTNLLNNCIKIS